MELDGGVLYSIAPVPDLTQVRSVHRTMLKPALPLPPNCSEEQPQSPSDSVSEASEDERLWLVIGVEPAQNPTMPVQPSSPVREPVALPLVVSVPAPVATSAVSDGT